MGRIREQTHAPHGLQNRDIKITPQGTAHFTSTSLANSVITLDETYCTRSDQERDKIKHDKMSLLTKQLNNSSWGRTSQALASTLVTHETFQQFDINATCDKTIYLTKKTSDINIDILDLMTALKQCYDKEASNGLTKLCFKVLDNGTVCVTFKQTMQSLQTYCCPIQLLLKVKKNI